MFSQLCVCVEFISKICYTLSFVYIHFHLFSIVGVYAARGFSFKVLVSAAVRNSNCVIKFGLIFRVKLKILFIQLFNGEWITQYTFCWKDYTMRIFVILTKIIEK